MKKKIFAAALATLGLAAIPSGAQASLFVITFTGTIASGYGSYDQTNFFGLGTDLTAVTPAPQFTLQFTVDTDIPAGFTSSPTQQQLYNQNGNNPTVQSSFTLNGLTVSWSNTPGDGFDDSESVISRLNEYYNGAQYYDEVIAYSVDYKESTNSFDMANSDIYGFISEIVNTTDLTGAVDYQVQAGDGMVGDFRSRRYDDASGSFTRFINANLNITHVTVAPFSAAVPEPASWALMIAGSRRSA